MNLRINKLSWKISLVVTGVILVFGLLTIFGTYQYSLNSFTKQKKNEAVNIVQYTLNMITESLNQAQSTVWAIAHDQDIIDFLEKGKATDTPMMIRELENHNSRNLYAAIYVMNHDGIVLASTDASFMKQNYAFRDYFVKSVNGEVFNDVNLGVTSKKLGYYFSSPVKNREGLVVGVTVVKMNSSVIMDIIKPVINEPMSDLMITDRWGVIINSANNQRLYKSVGELPSFEKEAIKAEKKYEGVEITGIQYDPAMELIRNQHVGVTTISMRDDDDDDSEVLVIASVGNFGYHLVGEVSLSEINNQAVTVSKIIGLMVGLTVVISMLLIVLFVSRMLRPIEKLTLLARDISMGKFGNIELMEGEGDLESLNNSMVAMANDLEEKYNDLEKEVSERTVKLDNQNEMLEKSKMAILNILEDVGSAKTDLEKFKLAVDEASDHIVITDSEGIILFANKAVERITGFSNREVVGQKAGSKELWGGLMDKSFYKKMWTSIKTNKKPFMGEINNKRKNGEKYISLSSISPILSQSGEVDFFVGIERDITHEKEVDRMKTDFISLASHQLRTPLSAMRWFCEMLLAGDAGKMTKEQVEFVKNIEQSNLRMITLVNSLLNISRIESGRIVVDPEPTDLRKLVDQELLGIDKQIKDKKQTVIVSSDKSLPLINVDPKLIAEVYKNLLTNANKYTQDGGEIEVFISCKDDEIISRVSDNGLGIPKAGQDKVFDRFYRAENVLKLETEGTGLGLYLARAIVESSGGKIWFESNLGKGTTFWFSLPTKGVKKKKGDVAINS